MVRTVSNATRAGVGKAGIVFKPAMSACMSRAASADEVTANTTHTHYVYGGAIGYIQTMTTREEIIRSLRAELVRYGFAGRGRSLRIVRPEVAWLIHLELIPRTSQVGVCVGICPAVLACDGWPTRANDCPIILYPASGGAEMFGHDTGETWQALDSESTLTEEARNEVLDRLADAMWSASEETATLDELKRASAAGKLTAFVHKDARALLG
ncbi:hypothetical protein [Microbacterium endophyticum]|nr:hypothetical protein [Microbacterium endophyticum]